MHAGLHRTSIMQPDQTRDCPAVQITLRASTELTLWLAEKFGSFLHVLTTKARPITTV